MGVSRRIVLTDEQRASLEAVIDGADVYSYGIAKDLREIERTHPSLIKIGKAQMYRGTGVDQMPYFGAIATAAGRRALDAMHADDELPPQAGERLRDITHDIHRRGCGVED